MSKRSATQTFATSDEQPFSKATSSGGKRKDPITSEMGEFEDDWEDELESDEEVVISRQEREEDEMEVDEEPLQIIKEDEEEETELAPSIFIPGTHVLADDEILEADDTVYELRHSMNVNWPCLSFDILRDDLGEERHRYPEAVYVVAGTQADQESSNELCVYKMSSLHKTQRDGDAEDSDSDEDAENLDEDAILEYRSIPHVGGVNRVRAQPLPSSAPLPPVTSPYYVASWADTGKVHIWDVRPLIESLQIPGYVPDKLRTHSPVFTISSHGRAEGFAMDWASSGGATPSSLRLLTGDVHSKMYLTTTTPSGFNALAQPFLSHTSSVEDIQWSPTDPTIFASCSADRSIRIWDVRVKGRKSVVGISEAHQSDVNVISWNKGANSNYLLVSGGDEGALKAWDLRNIGKQGLASAESAPVAFFTWHKAAITSVEWHPTEDSIFAASGADDQVTLWDLAVEQDEEEVGGNGAMEEGEREVPPQLLFVHQGQRDIKEVHWHPQVPGVVISTALDGFNVFKTISV